MTIRHTLAACALIALTSATAMAGINTNVTLVKEDSTGGTTWYIGSDGATADFDTSVVYDVSLWDDATIQVKSAPACACGAGADSGAVVVVLQASNDEVYWTPIDSLQVADSLAAFKDLAWAKYRHARFIMHHHTKRDSAGVAASVYLNYWGRK